MKTARFLFAMMIGTVLLRGTSLASQSKSAPQQATSHSSERSPGDHSFNVQKDGEVRGEKDQTPSGQANGAGEEPSASVKRTPAKHRPSTSYSKPTHSYPLRPGKTATTNSLTPNAPGSVAVLQQAGSKTAPAAPGKVVSRRSVTSSPATVALNGQQFRNSRDPGARLATTGGPLTAAKGTAMISGSNLKRKP